MAKIKEKETAKTNATAEEETATRSGETTAQIEAAKIEDRNQSDANSEVQQNAEMDEENKTKGVAEKGISEELEANAKILNSVLSTGVPVSEQAKAIADNTFAKYDLETVFITSDMICFANKTAAQNHADSLSDKEIKTINKA